MAEAPRAKIRTVHGEMKEVEGGQSIQGLVGFATDFGLYLKGADMIFFFFKKAFLSTIWLWKINWNRERLSEERTTPKVPER